MSKKYLCLGIYFDSIYDSLRKKKGGQLAHPLVNLQQSELYLITEH